MIMFVNQFISYFIIVIVSMGIIVLAVFLGKKWRDAKDKKDAVKLEAEIEAKKNAGEVQAEEF